MYSYGIFDTKGKPRKGQGSIQNGDSGGQREWRNRSCLARLIEDENPAMAIELFERSLAMKYDSDDVNERDVRAVRILTWLGTTSVEAMEAWDKLCAPCNLAHLHS